MLAVYGAALAGYGADSKFVPSSLPSQIAGHREHRTCFQIRVAFLF